MGQTVTSQLGGLLGLIDAQVSELLDLMPSQAVGVTELVGVERVLSRLDFACTRMVASYAEDGNCVDAGFRDVSAALSYHAHVRKSEGTNRLRCAHVLGMLASFNTAASTGAISRDHVTVLASFVTVQREPLALRDEEALLQGAATLNVSDFTKVLQRWASLCDDELNDPTSDSERHEKRGVNLRQLADGTWMLKGTLDPEAGQALEAAIDKALQDPVPQTEHSDDDCKDRRNFPQRRHDALHDIAIQSLQETSTVTATGKTSISLIVNPDGTAHTPNGYFVSSFTRDMLMCDAVLTAIKVNCNGIPFDVGTPLTEIPLRNRRAVIARDRCCRYPGCDRPARWSDIHHIQEREHGGTHQLQNLVLMCRFHHRFIHKFGVAVAWAGDQITLTIRTRNGNLLHAPPHPETLLSLHQQHLNC